MDDVFELYWKHFRTQLKSWWDRLDDEDIQYIDGKRENLIALLQAKYGYSAVECENLVRRRIDEFEQRHRNKLGTFIQGRRRYVLVLPKNENAVVTSFQKLESSSQNDEFSHRKTQTSMIYDTQKVGTKYDKSI